MQIETSLNSFFNPKSVAIIGASSKPGKLGSYVVRNIVSQGFKGKIYPINPDVNEVFGLKCYPSLAELPEVPDLSVILIPASQVVPSLKDHQKKGVNHVIVMSAGFKEIGEQGKVLEDEIKNLINSNGIRLVGPNCLGIFDNISRVDSFFLPRDLIQRPNTGVVSLASQSGSFVAHIMDLASFEHLGISRVLAYGNKADVNEVDALEYFADDPHTKVVGLYLEDVVDGREFVRAAQYCSAKKPVIVLKTGKFDSLKHALTSHTGAIAGSYNSYVSAFRRSSLIEVHSEIEFIDACKAVALLPKARGNRVLILGPLQL